MGPEILLRLFVLVASVLMISGVTPERKHPENHKTLSDSNVRNRGYGFQNSLSGHKLINGNIKSTKLMDDVVDRKDTTEKEAYSDDISQEDKMLLKGLQNNDFDVTYRGEIEEPSILDLYNIIKKTTLILQQETRFYQKKLAKLEASYQNAETKMKSTDANIARLTKHWETDHTKLEDMVANLKKQVKKKTGKDQAGSCSHFDQHTAMMYGMWQNLAQYSVPANGTLKVIHASSSSVAWSGLPSRAVDGNKDTNYWATSCSHTRKEVRPWLLLKLAGLSEVTGVEITNRGDCCHKRLTNFTIEVLKTDPRKKKTSIGLTSGSNETECYHYPGTVGTAVTVAIKCTSPVKGRYVKITLLSDVANYLTICEAVVKGNLLSLTSAKPSMQSSTASAQTGPEMANDDDTRTCSITMADPVDGNPWWQVDLGEMVEVKYVHIRGRKQDKSIWWLKNTIISVHKQFPSECVTSPSDVCKKVTWKDVGKGLASLKCRQPITGRYLKISRQSKMKGETLSLCEVAVNLNTIVNE